jgi:dihydrofolate reductase
MIVSLVLARGENGVIGRGNGLPWRLPRDLRHFKQLTTDHTIIMGRKTYDTIGRPLPNRRSIVISRNPRFAAEGVEVAGSLEEALKLAAPDDEVFVIGGAQIYQEALPVASRIYVTSVHASPPGDVTFPPVDESVWRLAESESFDADEQNQYGVTFEVFERR